MRSLLFSQPRTRSEIAQLFVKPSDASGSDAARALRSLAAATAWAAEDEGGARPVRLIDLHGERVSAPVIVDSHDLGCGALIYPDHSAVIVAAPNAGPWGSEPADDAEVRVLPIVLNAPRILSLASGHEVEFTIEDTAHGKRAHAGLSDTLSDGHHAFRRFNASPWPYDFAEHNVLAASTLSDVFESILCWARLIPGTPMLTRPQPGSGPFHTWPAVMPASSVSRESVDMLFRRARAVADLFGDCIDDPQVSFVVDVRSSFPLQDGFAPPEVSVRMLRSDDVSQLVIQASSLDDIAARLCLGGRTGVHEDDLIASELVEESGDGELATRLLVSAVGDARLSSHRRMELRWAFRDEHRWVRAAVRALAPAI